MGGTLRLDSVSVNRRKRYSSNETRFVQPAIKPYGQRSLAVCRPMIFLLPWIRYWMVLQADYLQKPILPILLQEYFQTNGQQRLGLPTDVVIGVGAFDAHMGAVGGQIEPYHLSKVMGTSTCDMLVAPMNEVEGKLVKGICGQVPGSVIPGMMGMEAGQSAFGDAYAWFKNILAWPLQNILAAIIGDLMAITSEKLIEETLIKSFLNSASSAEQLPLEENAELAIDWINGRRTPDANQELKGAIMGLSLGYRCS